MIEKDHIKIKSTDIYGNKRLLKNYQRKRMKRKQRDDDANHNNNKDLRNSNNTRLMLRCTGQQQQNSAEFEEGKQNESMCIARRCERDTMSEQNDEANFLHRVGTSRTRWYTYGAVYFANFLYLADGCGMVIFR